MAYHDGEASATGSLDAVVDAQEIDGQTVELNGKLKAFARAGVYQNVTIPVLYGTLDVSTETVMYKDSYVIMYGFLSSEIGASVFVGTTCVNFDVDMEIQTIEVNGCGTGEDMEEINIIRHRGDDYPITAKLGRNGNFDTTGIEFKMSTKIGETGTVYTSTGIIQDAEKGIVSFPFSAEAVATVGEGIYDIQGVDAYTYTYQSGMFALMQDVTP